MVVGGLKGVFSDELAEIKHLITFWLDSHNYWFPALYTTTLLYSFGIINCRTESDTEQRKRGAEQQAGSSHSGHVRWRGTLHRANGLFINYLLITPVVVLFAPYILKWFQLQFYFSCAPLDSIPHFPDPPLLSICNPFELLPLENSNWNPFKCIHRFVRIINIYIHSLTYIYKYKYNLINNTE